MRPAPAWIAALARLPLAPPMVQPDGSYEYPDPPMAMLIRENGQ